MTVDHSHQSPNHSSRDGAPISLIVLHATVGSYDASLAWLCNPASRVSTHYLIRKDGYIAQLVADSEAAWHAGKSQWHGLDSADIQKQSLGIELENKNNGIDPYPSTQMAALLELSRHLVAKYGIVPEMTTRHLDIAVPAGRKSDPAGFPWAAFKASLFAPPAPPVLHTATAGPYGAIAQQSREPKAMAAKYYPPGTLIVCDDLTNDYWHTADEAGFIPVGQVQG